MATPTTLPASFVSGAVLTAAQMNNLRGAFRVLQIVQTSKTDTFTTTTGNAATDMTGMSVTITPSATTNQVLIVAQLSVSTNTGGGLLLVRGTTPISRGDVAGSRSRISTGYIRANDAGSSPASHSIVFLDSPATTSATTYKIQAFGDQAGSVVYLNRGATDTDSAAFFRGASNIIAMEVSA